MNIKIHGIQYMMTNTKISFLNLVGSGLSLIERLALEEALLRHDKLHRNWAIIGMHDPIYGSCAPARINVHQNHLNNYDTCYYYPGCAVVLGLGGKPDKLVNLASTHRDNVLLVKRFSGGGTVVVDHDSLLTTFIGRTKLMSHVPPYPRDIMQWSSDAIFTKVFDDALSSSSSSKKKKTLVMQGKSCGLSDVVRVGPIVPEHNNMRNPSKSVNFSLQENDYVLGHKKMGGNAQAIVKGGWLHHTSFLWDYVDEHMEYLTLPEKRPDYRGDRSHNDFLVKLNSFYNDNDMSKHSFFEQVKGATNDAFEMEEVTMQDALSVVQSEFGSMQAWYDGNCRTRVIDHASLL